MLEIYAQDDDPSCWTDFIARDVSDASEQPFYSTKRPRETEENEEEDDTETTQPPRQRRERISSGEVQENDDAVKQAS